MKIECKAYTTADDKTIFYWRLKQQKLEYGKRTFDYAAPRLWNALSLEVRMEEKIGKVNRQIEPILFHGTEELK